MKTIEVNKNLIDDYLKLLHSLSTNNKLDLISRLTQSIKDEVNDKSLFYKSFGAWESMNSADEIILEIRKSRRLKRRVEEF